MTPLYVDRIDAGRQLVKVLQDFRESSECISVGLARGGVVPAYVIAQALEIPLDVIVPRKVGAPFNPELAIAAVTESGAAFYNVDLLEMLGVTEDDLREELQSQGALAKDRMELYRKILPPTSFQDKTVLLVDDGLATGATMKASIQAALEAGAAQVIAVVPVSPVETAIEIRAMEAELVVLSTPENFQSVGQFYHQFPAVEDEEVIDLLTQYKKKSSF